MTQSRFMPPWAVDEAVEQFEAAVAIRPQDAVANNALGGALLSKSDADGAVRHFTVALASQPDYFDARYNLDDAYAAQGNFTAAVEHW